MLIKQPLLLFLLLILPVSVMGDHQNYKVVCHQETRLHIAPSAFSRQIKLIKYGEKIIIENEKGIWIKISSPFQGYILKSAIISFKKLEKGYYSQSKIKKDKMIKDFRKKKTPPTTGTKKGFNKETELLLKEKNSQYRYDSLDLIDKKGRIKNKAKEFKAWRKQGDLGEYTFGESN